jgi:hypothetical protein
MTRSKRKLTPTREGARKQHALYQWKTESQNSKIK